MRIFTRVVWEWQGDELVQTEADSYEYSGPVSEAKGGKGPKNYANLERLYGIQADQAEFLGQTFKNTVAPAYKGWLAEAQDYGSQANQELAAKRAGTAVSGAVSQQQASLQADLASMGINPADSRYTQGMREMGIQGAGQQAAAETTAREGIRDKGFARQQDAISLGMGTPTQASQAANSAANAATANLTAQNQRDQNQAQAASSIAQAGMNLGDSYMRNNPSSTSGGGYADGGQVQKRGILRLKQGGYVQRLAQGGFAGQGGGGGFMGTPQVQAPPPTAGPSGPTAGQQVGQAAATPLGMYGIKQGVGKAAELGGQAAGSPGTTAFGQGMQMNSAQLKSAQQFNQAATKQAAEAQVDKAMGVPDYSAASHAATPAETDAALASAQAGAGQNAAALETSQLAATTAADAETALAASTAAETALAGEAATAAAATEGLAATGAGLGAGGAAGAALGTAVPVLGAGLALYGIGNAAGWWADGGEVTPGSQNQTGEVDGPGGPKDDEILAALSDGEFVMPKGVVSYYGIKHMENMRKKGLEYEKQMGIA